MNALHLPSLLPKTSIDVCTAVAYCCVVSFVPMAALVYFVPRGEGVVVVVIVVLS